MSIQEHLNKIRNAIYGREVRESIAKGIETAYDDASENGNANMEVKLARGTNPNLNTRLNKMDETDRQNTERIDSNYNETTAQLAQKATKGEIGITDLDKNKTQFDETWMTDEFKQQMAGDTPIHAIPADNSLSTSKYIDDSVTLDKVDKVIEETARHLYHGKPLFRTMYNEPTAGGVSNAYGWLAKVTYEGEEISGARAFVPLRDLNGEIVMRIFSPEDKDSILFESYPVKVSDSGYYNFILKEKITPANFVGDSFFVAVESVGRTARIANSIDGNVTGRIIASEGFYQRTYSGSWYRVSSDTQFAISVEFLGSFDLNEKVDDDEQYQTMKDSVKSLATANRLFASRTDDPEPSTYASSFFGWATPVAYYGERITSSEIYLNMNSYNGEVISTIRDEDMNILATSLPVKPEENKFYAFNYDNEINESLVNSDVIIVTVESQGGADIIRQPFVNSASGENRLISDAQYKYKGGSGNWVNASGNTSFALYAIFYNNSLTEAFNNKVDRPKETHINTLSFPERFYTVSNDIDYSNENERHFALPIYTEYLANTYHNMVFENGLDREYLISDELSSDTETKDIDLVFGPSDYVGDDSTTTQQITKASVPNKKSFVLTIGDSVTAQNKYWRFANELFEKEAIDFDRDNNVTFVGTANKRLENEIDYKGGQKTIYASAEGRSGWDGLSFFRYSTVRRPSQETWDVLGLGDGSGTDYTGSDEQKKLIQKTNEVNPTDSPGNPFFDNDKTGSNRFSIQKWLERYRTLDDNGNRLELGNGTGTKITADNLNQIDVCTPTHIVLALGHNDLASQGLDAFYEYMQEWISEIKAQLPNVTILVVLSIPRIGLWDKNRYPNFYGIPSPYNLGTYHDNVNIWLNHFKDINEEEEKLFLLPQFYVTPSAEAFNTIEHVDSSGNKIHQKIGDDKHPGYRAHLNWGYQLYALLKYTMTL